MSDRIRLAMLALLLAGGSGLVAALIRHKAATPLSSSLAPAFAVVGMPLKSINHLLTRVIPIDDIDEQQFGEVYRADYDATWRAADPDQRYLDDLMRHLSHYATRPFDYHAYVIEGGEPNAMALPGGVLLVTRGLLQNLGSESELVSVLGHEMGHVEQGHCIDAVRFEVLAGKMGARPFGELADFGLRVLTSHSFSKNQEDEADQYGYTLMVNSEYDPRGTARAFASLIQFEKHQENGESTGGANPLRDYFSSHPPLEIREATFRERAEAWWRAHPREVRVVGRSNLTNRISTWRRPDSVSRVRPDSAAATTN